MKSTKFHCLVLKKNIYKNNRYDRLTLIIRVTLNKLSPSKGTNLE